MIEALQQYNRNRYEFYKRQMARFGLKCGLALKSMEDSLRRELLDHLAQYSHTNTSIANLLSKHEKTVRNLKRKYRTSRQSILEQNRMFRIASLVHDRTWSDANKWLAFDTVMDAYLDSDHDDTDFSDEVLKDVLSMLVAEGTLIEKRQQYSVFYRTSTATMDRVKVATDSHEALDVIAAITESFQASADRVADHPDILSQTKFSEWTARISDPKKIAEINQKLRAYCRDLIAEYEEDAETDSNAVPLKVITLVGCEAES